MANEKIGVVLAGCGHLDGAEIREAVLTLLSLDERQAQAVCLAQDIDQMHVVDHLKGAPAEPETRNVRTESARIARGEVVDLASAKIEDFDALIFPGGFGVAKNLFDFAVKGTDCTVRPDVAKLVLDAHAAGKPVGFICIAPALGAAIFRDAGIGGMQLTVGDEDVGAAQAIEAMGAVHLACPVTEARVDTAHRIVSTPAYMYAEPRLADVRRGIDALVGAVLELTRQPHRQ